MQTYLQPHKEHQWLIEAGGQERTEEEIIKECKKTLGGDENDDYLNCGYDFTHICVCMCIKTYQIVQVKYVHYCQLYFNNAVKKLKK